MTLERGTGETKHAGGAGWAGPVRFRQRDAAG